MSTLQDIQYSLETSFIKKRLKKSKQQIIGFSTEKEKFSWEWLGMMLASGRWNGFLSEEKRLEILSTILLYSNVMQIQSYPEQACLYQYKDCIGSTAYFAPVTDIIDSEMIQSLKFANGTLTLKTNKQTFTTQIPHNELSGLQGGKSPDEYYHLNKAKHDEINAVPQVAATANMNVTPATFQQGFGVTPTVVISYNPGTDVITGHTLTRNGNPISLNAVNPAGGSQTIADSVVSTDTTYVYTVFVEGKSPIVVTRTITAAAILFYGNTISEPNASQILAGTQSPKNSNLVTLNYTADDQYLWIAYPKSFGLLNSILNSQGYENLPAFSQGYPKTVVLTIGGNSVEYYLYVNNLAVSVTAYQLRFYFNS
jgi:hypothetical protein